LFSAADTFESSSTRTSGKHGFGDIFVCLFPLPEQQRPREIRACSGHFPMAFDFCRFFTGGEINNFCPGVAPIIQFFSLNYQWGYKTQNQIYPE